MLTIMDERVVHCLRWTNSFCVPKMGIVRCLFVHLNLLQILLYANMERFFFVVCVFVWLFLLGGVGVWIACIFKSLAKWSTMSRQGNRFVSKKVNLMMGQNGTGWHSKQMITNIIYQHHDIFFTNNLGGCKHPIMPPVTFHLFEPLIFG